MTRSVIEGDIVWLPERDSFDASALGAFVRRVQDRDHPEVSDYPSLLGWSVAHPDEFWSLVADDAAITWHDTPTAVLTNPSMPGATWFPGGTLNYVDLALRRRDDSAAIIFQREDGAQDELSWSELADHVRRAAAGLRRLGVECGDRVAAYVPN
ncbi:MAG: acetyl-coenzyme A synthetase N-terminal domain-containing protein, partial [Acidimicrobiia bacterium]